MSNARTILWLTVLTVLAIGANVFLMTEHRVQARSLAHVPLVDPSFSPTAVTITRENRSSTVLAKADRWSLARPFVGAVDNAVVLRLLDTLAFTPAEDVLTDAELLRLGRSREDFGLDSPAFGISLSDGARTTNLSFGGMTPSSAGVYVAVSGTDAVFVLPSSMLDAVDLTTDELRAREIFPFAPDFVDGFDLRNPDGAVQSFTRDGENWRVGENVAAATKVNDFLLKLSDLNAVDFVWPVGTTNEAESASSALLSSFGLDAESALAMTLRCQDGRDRRILLGRNAGSDKIYALVHNGSAIVTLDAAFKTDVLSGSRVFADARLFPLDEAVVSAYTLQEGDVSYVVARGDGDSWRLDAPVSAPADAETVTAILGRILTLTSTDVSEHGIKVSVSTNLAPLVVSTRSLLGEHRLEDLRSREILRIDPALVRRIVSTPGGRNSERSAAVVYSRERRAWSVESETERDVSVNEKGVKQVLAELSSLKAIRIVSLKATSTDFSRYGLEKPFYTIAVDQDKEDSVRRNILIGAVEKTGCRYATVGSAEAIFLISKDTVEALTANLSED